MSEDRDIVSSERAFGRLEGKVDGIADALKVHMDQEDGRWTRLDDKLRIIDDRVALTSISPDEHAMVIDQARWIAMVRGNLKWLATFVVAISGSIVYLAVQWVSWLHGKLGGSGITPR